MKLSSCSWCKLFFGRVSKSLSILLLMLFFSINLCSCNSAQDKTVLIAILARNKAHTLPMFLETIENLDYNKKAITIYINTNNNLDETENILKEWVEINKNDYQNIIFESHSVEELCSDESNPHEWNMTRFKVLGHIRNRSLEVATDCGCDYYFTVDCDVFIKPFTLKTLMEKNKPFIAPMMRTYPASLFASTYWCDVADNGFYKDAPFYYQILNRSIIGTFAVPLVHCVYLIQSEFLPKLNYIDDSTHCEFMVFSKSARDQNVQQYICNEKDFGFVYFVDASIELEDERTNFKSLFPEY